MDAIATDITMASLVAEVLPEDAGASAIAVGTGADDNDVEEKVVVDMW